MFPQKLKSNGTGINGNWGNLELLRARGVDLGLGFGV